MMFRDQVGVLAGWFKGWNECEQTVALLSLLKRVSQTQARFLQLCLEHSLADCAELHVLEGEANSPGKCAAVDSAAPRESSLPASSPGSAPAPPPPGLHPRGPGPHWPRGSEHLRRTRPFFTSPVRFGALTIVNSLVHSVL